MVCITKESPERVRQGDGPYGKWVCLDMDVDVRYCCHGGKYVYGHMKRRNEGSPETIWTSLSRRDQYNEFCIGRNKSIKRQGNKTK